jgi:hypothetical protein
MTDEHEVCDQSDRTGNERRADAGSFMQQSLDLLARRIAELDQVPCRCSLIEVRKLSGDQLRGYTWAAHFVNVMSCYTPGVMGPGATSYVIGESAAADEIVAGSRLLASIRESEPGLVDRPLQKDRQHWIVTGTNQPVRPSKVRFVVPSIEQPDVKPTNCGLYTSTAMSAGYSMWRAYIGLDTANLYPLRWYTWKMEVAATDIQVAEITCASDWVGLVAAYGRLRGDSLYPDWAGIARVFHAVHVTLPAIAATQGFSFYARDRLIPPVFWDVETTFWLRWSFTDAELVDQVGGKDDGE